MRINWDVWGISASVACAIHCAVLPIFITALPLFGWEILHNPWFEGGMIGLAFLIGTLTLYHGYKHHHRQWLPVMLFVAGFICLVTKEGFSEGSALHRLLLIPAVGLIVPAHFLNLRYTARSRKPAASGRGTEGIKAA
jgi:hypothetical protein